MKNKPLDIAGFLKLVIEALDAAGVEYLIGGAIAEWAWGEPRATQDLDLVVKIPIKAINKFSKELKKRDMLIPAEIILDSILEDRADIPLNAIHMYSGLKADLYPVREGDELRESAFRRRQQVDYGPPIGKVYIHLNMFGQAPDDVLADVADLLEEMEVSENETVFSKGDPGDSMYIIVDGRVRVHIEEQLLNYLGESDVFGEMALLDPEPRIASVTAVEPTRLFRLDQAPFFQLIAERPGIATGIIHVLTRLLRDRVHNLSLLDGRVKELERAISGVRRQNI